MQKLNLPEYDLKWKEENGLTYIYDPFRSRYLQLTPEEYVRQRFAQYLVQDRNYPAGLMQTEHALKLNNMLKRCDILVRDPSGAPAVIVECKAPKVKIQQEVFDQVARYNLTFRVKYLMVTNGMQHYCCSVEQESGRIEFLKEIPEFNAL